MTCPRCRTAEAHRSRRRWYERPLAAFGVLPYRCAACTKRYLARRATVEPGATLDTWRTTLQSGCRHVHLLDEPPSR